MTFFKLDPDLWNEKQIESEKYSNFVKHWKKDLKDLLSDEKFDQKLLDYSELIKKMRNELTCFQEFLTNTPIMVALAHWVRGEVKDSKRAEGFASSMNILLAKKILPFKSKNNEILTLEDLKEITHEKIIEDIRCEKEWSLLEKEELIQCYIFFSQHLSQMTLGFIPEAFDPDRKRVVNKVVKYGSFLDFVQNLPIRDALIAKLLYFGAPSIDEVLHLKKKQIELKTNSIRFQSHAFSFPKHLIQELKEFVLNIPQDHLVFTNMRNNVIERSHLNQSFARASVKMNTSQKITPGILLKLKSTFED